MQYGIEAPSRELVINGAGRQKFSSAQRGKESAWLKALLVGSSDKNQYVVELFKK